MTPQQRLATREFFGIKLGLDTMAALVEALGHPERTFLPVIVAGTNGKGSVTAMVSRALRAAGLRAGRYTSPHLVHLRERFAIDDVDVDDDVLDNALDAVFDAEAALLSRAALPGPATYFELTTAAALVVFRAAAVDVAVVEVGLGGRHDATNIVRAPYAAITSIAFDHMAHLGDTLAAIAREKAGVIMPGAIVVSGVGDHEAAAVIADTCAAQGANLVRADEDAEVDVTMHGGETTIRLRTPFRAYGPVRLALRGGHQVTNAVVAVRLLEALEFAGVGGGAKAITTGLADASWPGRLERRTLANGVPLVLDGAHNPAGAEALARWLREAGFWPMTLVTACMRDKDVEGLLSPLLPLATRIVATAVDFPRALPATDLAATIRALAPGLPVQVAPSPAAAMAAASEHRARAVVAGSLLLVGAVRAWLDAAPVTRDPA
ncbi:Folylpolyglutamate synthase [Luteitalea pratensis]|uniref:Dihydrofolate synthase/folylpolyglutamate synthase n=1 Tax=Luteitalea pratensis TaxID=1855912 RepID=A0A143PXK8_LUTPR|nr:Mur ligase family protein [Luteitalea pratensis]AMY12574.1 Folylpolyglutamate synthase [Luteitalea pratensis]